MGKSEFMKKRRKNGRNDIDRISTIYINQCSESLEPTN